MRQYISKSFPDKNGLLAIEGKDFRYLKQVLRIAVGDMVSVRLPDGSLSETTVCKIDEHSKRVLLQVCTVDSGSSDGVTGGLSGFSVEAGAIQVKPLDFWLFMFVPKPSKFDLIVRQATECGISRIIPVSSEFSQSGADRMNFRGERFSRIIKEARQQCGSAVDTHVEDCCSVEEACRMWSESSQENAFGCVCYERSDFTMPVHAAVAGVPKIERCALVCGAEGGISPAEIEQLKDSGFVPVHFETNILRCETAALYGIAVVQNAVREKNIWQSNG